MLRVSLPSASSVPYPVGVKNAPKPAPPAWILAARFPCGTSSSSISPARYSASNTCESVCRGNEQMIFFTRLALSSAASPVSPLPALLLTIVRSLAPRSMRASINSPGMPAVPKPPIITVAPSKTSATAAVGETTVLSIMDRRAVGLCGGLEKRPGFHGLAQRRRGGGGHFRGKRRGGGLHRDRPAARLLCSSWSFFCGNRGGLANLVGFAGAKGARPKRQPW